MHLKNTMCLVIKRTLDVFTCQTDYRVIIAASPAVGVLVSYERGHWLRGGRHVSAHSCARQRQDSNLGASALGCQGRGLVVGWLSGVFALLRTQPLRLRCGEFPSLSCGALCRPPPGLGAAPCGAYRAAPRAFVGGWAVSLTGLESLWGPDLPRALLVPPWGCQLMPPAG